MRFSTTGALAACVAVGAAFKDTSPFFLFSTSEWPSNVEHFSTNQLQSSADLLKSTKRFLSSCSSDIYVLVSQPNLSALDFSSSKTAPYLRRAMSSKDFETRVGICDVVGELAADDLQSYLVTHCGVDVVQVDVLGMIPSKFEKSKLLLRANLPPLPATSREREVALGDHDAFIQSLVATLDTEKYTVIFTSTPATNRIVSSTPPYQPAFQEPMYMDLKRRTDFEIKGDNASTVDRTPLFEKYQFFTPGLFMGLLVTFLLLSILAVGLNGLSSLQVSYGAFEKEMGPAAQKKAM